MYLGIDIGGTTIKGGLFDETGQLLESHKAPTIVNDLDAFISKLTELIRDFQKSSSVDAIGIGVPGLRSSRRHTIDISPNIPCLKNVNLEEMVANQVQVPVISENDANVGAYAEFVSGAAKGTRNMVYLTLGTGLGSGVVLNGTLFTGSSGYGGELGHTTIDPNGRACTCGNHGCLEAFVSGPGIVVTAYEKMKDNPASLLHTLPQPLTSELIFEAAVRGDPTAIASFDETGRYLGIACANLINLLNLDMIVIGGGVMAAGEMLLRPAIEEARRRAFPPSFAVCEIVQSKLWPDAGIIGAAMLARDQ